MNRAHITVALVWLASLAVWWWALAQLSQPRLHQRQHPQSLHLDPIPRTLNHAHPE
jgi:hypothetical protein